MARELGHDLLPVEEVRAEILSLLSALPVEACPLALAYNRILREDLEVGAPIPPFDNSAMDGYAVRSADLASASPEKPVHLGLAGVVPAGASGPGSFGPVSFGPVPFGAGPLESGAAVRIMTGAPVPAGADAVVPHELTACVGGRIRFESSARFGSNIRLAGSELQPGELALARGVRLRGPQLALAASLGRAELRVTRRARVAVLSPGNELVEPGRPLGPGQIYSSNQLSIAGFLVELGAEPIPMGIIADDRAAIRAAIGRAAEAGADAVISTGGVSAGDYDFIQAILREDGRPGKSYKVAMRPGKPLAFGRVDGLPVFGLPGNPASAVISFIVFARPALRLLLGETRVLAERFGVEFTEPFRYRPGREFFLRARVGAEEPDGGRLRVLDVGAQDSNVLTSLARANALVALPGDRSEALPGESFPAEWIHG